MMVNRENVDFNTVLPISSLSFTLPFILIREMIANREIFGINTVLLISSISFTLLPS